uniref:Septin 10 n=1 Tax=Electrophorus electricus TaxID=8005 RepID=A0AAY5EFW6_ELEEL
MFVCLFKQSLSVCAPLLLIVATLCDITLDILSLFVSFFFFICPRPLSLSGHAGFDRLPDQLVNESRSQGFYFIILCIGEDSSTMNFEPSHFELKVRLRAQTCDLQAKERNVGLNLTSIFASVFLGLKHFAFYKELKVKRSLHNHQDSRIHACLSIMAPAGHSLKSLDLVIMKNLDSKSIIPVIAKTDTSSKSELHKFKIKIMSELASNGVQIFQFPTDGDQHGHECMCWNVSTSKPSLHYPWAVMLIWVNMEDLREQTHTHHYELYRHYKLGDALQQTYEQCEEMRQTFVQREERKTLEEKMLSFSTRRPAAQLFKAQSLNTNDGSKMYV